MDTEYEEGFFMIKQIEEGFCWYELEEDNLANLPPAQAYRQITQWAADARGHNPVTFDKLSEWILDDSQWTQDKLAANEKFLMEDIIGRFRSQNARLRACLNVLQPSGVVNPAVFPTLDRFDKELTGLSVEAHLQPVVRRLFSDFSTMKDATFRKQIAGDKTGPTGTDYVSLFGYINELKNGDASVQWALFMPDLVEKQQQGFKLESFSCKRMPALRFIGQEETPSFTPAMRQQVFQTLDTLADYRSGFDHDLFFMHHYGLTVDVGPWHGFWGRFMKADTPVPEGFISFDLIQRHDGKSGAPFLSQFTYATFLGDEQALHRREGYDSDAMYDVTRNIMLAQDIIIPYPDKYWTAEVFLQGYERPGSAYLFSAVL